MADGTLGALGDFKEAFQGYHPIWLIVAAWGLALIAALPTILKNFWSHQRQNKKLDAEIAQKQAQLARSIEKRATRTRNTSRTSQTSTKPKTGQSQ